MNETSIDALCGCCEGVAPLTPAEIVNRLGLDALAYRVGTHAAFLETMQARLSTADFPELAGLTARTGSDPAIALLDAWATVADVLTFYQERIANEGYLRTAAERRSVLELARLVGYALRPGVAASVYLAYTLEDDYKVEIPAGARSQSLPGPGELPESFETSDPLEARAEWNNLKPRRTRPQKIELSKNGKTIDTETIYFQGTATNLKPNDLLLFVFGEGARQQIVRHVKNVEAQAAENRTKVTLREARTALGQPAVQPLAGAITPPVPEKTAFALVGNLVGPLSIPPSRQPGSSQRLVRDLVSASERDTVPQLLTALRPELGTALYTAWANVIAVKPQPLTIYALRAKASLFGHNALKEPQYDDRGRLTRQDGWAEWNLITDEAANELFLDNAYDQIQSESWVAIQKADDSDPQIFDSIGVAFLSRTAYGVSGKTTKITLNGTWRDKPDSDPPRNISEIRSTVVYAQSEELALAEAPIEEPVCGARLETGALYDGLKSGRWLIVSGERADILDAAGEVVTGVKDSELVMLAGVEQAFDPTLPGDKVHSLLVLANGLAYCYKRDTLTIYGNVVHATHGETRIETLGSGDGSQTLQKFALRQSPLTYASASNPSGVESTLRVRINDVLWHKTDDMAAAGPKDRRYLARTDDESKTSVIFGNGLHGARLPTGVENVKAVYRTGIGKPGNARAEQISLLSTRPLGVKGVLNPLRASGGADRESRDQARRNAPLAVMALDRLVSVQDYADFARTFAGIGKVAAARLSDGRRLLVHVTIAGVEDIPIEEHSDLFVNLRRALHEFGDPHQPIQLAVRELNLLLLSAGVRVSPDYLWEKVEPKVRAALLEAFGFERRELGQDALLSEAVRAMQQVEGVEYVDVDVFGSVPSIDPDTGKAITPEKIAATILELTQKSLKDGPVARVPVNLATAETKKGIVHPAQIAFLTPAVKDTLVLKELTT